MSYWPRVADDESQLPVEREISRINSALPKVVISDTLTSEQTEPWGSTTRIVSRRDAAEAVRALKADGARGDILVFGSSTMWNALAEAGLVDELHVMVGPALVGGGPAIHQGGRIALRLREARRLDDSELVLLRYDVG